MDYYSRSAWQTATNGIYEAPPPRGVRTTWIIHDPGHHATIPTVFAKQREYIQNMNAFYRRDRGYDLGYSFIVFPNGAVFEVRGIDHNNAANAGRRVSGNANDWTLSCMVATAKGDKPTDAAIAAVNALIAKYGPDWKIQRHSDVDITSCPATFDEVTFARLGVIEPPLETGDEMKALATPRRWFDTRSWPFKDPLKGGVEFAIAPPNDLAEFTDFQCNVTVVDAQGGGHLTCWGSGERPNVSNLNFVKGATLANGSLLRKGADGKLRFWFHPNVGAAHLVVDIQGVR
jgi:hypothetical protein